MKFPTILYMIKENVDLFGKINSSFVMSFMQFSRGFVLF